MLVAAALPALVALHIFTTRVENQFIAIIIFHMLIIHFRNDHSNVWYIQLFCNIKYSVHSFSYIYTL